MNLIETKPVGETHLSHFAVDFGDADIRINGKQYPTGKVTHDILCLSPEWVKALFYKGMRFAAAGPTRDIPRSCFPK